MSVPVWQNYRSATVKATGGKFGSAVVGRRRLYVQLWADRYGQRSFCGNGLYFADNQLDYGHIGKYQA
ncbi:MAG: hypothetical protein NC350_02330 [Corallococcus sp.]|nr:hypothetical protein [Corallococcus sp.]